MVEVKLKRLAGKKSGSRAHLSPLPKHIKANHDPLLISLQILDNQGLVLPQEEKTLLSKVRKNLDRHTAESGKPLKVVIDERVTIEDPLDPQLGQQPAWHPRTHYLGQILSTMKNDYIPARSSLRWRTGSFAYGDAGAATRVYNAFGADDISYRENKTQWQASDQATRLSFLHQHGLPDMTPFEVDLLLRARDSPHGNSNIGLFISFRDMARKRCLRTAPVREHKQKHIMEKVEGKWLAQRPAKNLGEIGTAGLFIEVDLLDVVLFFLRTRRRKSYRRPVIDRCSLCARLFWKKQHNHHACCDLCRYASRYRRDKARRATRKARQ